VRAQQRHHSAKIGNQQIGALGQFDIERRRAEPLNAIGIAVDDGRTPADFNRAIRLDCEHSPRTVLASQQCEKTGAGTDVEHDCVRGYCGAQGACKRGSPVFVANHAAVVAYGVAVAGNHACPCGRSWASKDPQVFSPVCREPGAKTLR